MNEYLKEVQRLVTHIPGYHSDKRIELSKKYSWAIPSDEVLAEIAKYSPIVEIGAGTGYWGKLLIDLGVLYMGYDKNISNPNGHTNGSFHIAIYPGDESVLLKTNRDWNLFLCWPPYSDPMAVNCLKNFSGQFILYLGEGYMGCTGDEVFHEELEAQEKYELIKTVETESWPLIHDRLYIYKRKGFKE